MTTAGPSQLVDEPAEWIDMDEYALADEKWLAEPDWPDGDDDRELPNALRDPSLSGHMERWVAVMEELERERKTRPKLDERMLDVALPLERLASRKLKRHSGRDRA